MNKLLLVLLFTSFLNTYAAIYLYKDKDGVYHYYKKNNPEGDHKLIEEIIDIKRPGPLENNSDVQATIEAASKKYRVDPALIMAIIKAESNFRSSVVSEAGAEGIMQVMPSTAVQFGILNPFNYKENIFGGTRYLRYLLNTFMGNLQLSVAAYNAGETAVFKFGTIPPYDETQQYVKKVISFYNAYLFKKFKARNEKKLLKKSLQSVIIAKSKTKLVAENEKNKSQKNISSK